MNAAEYVSVLSSIVIGLALADVLFSLHKLLRARRRVKWDWAAPVAALLVVMVLVMMWWSFYEPRTEAAAALTIGDFLPRFVLLVLLFLLGGAALPDEVPAEGVSLRAYYDDNAAYFWSLFAAVLAWVIGTNVVGATLQGDAIHNVLLENVIEFAILGVFVSLIFVRRRWWQAAAFVILSSGPLGWLARSLS